MEDSKLYKNFVKNRNDELQKMLDTYTKIADVEKDAKAKGLDVSGFDKMLVGCLENVQDYVKDYQKVVEDVERREDFRKDLSNTKAMLESLGINTGSKDDLSQDLPNDSIKK